MRYEILKSNQPTVTGRIYPADVVEQICEKMMTDKVFVTIDQTASISVDLDRVAGRIVDPEINEGVLSAEIAILETPYGTILRTLEPSVHLRLSPVGTANVNADGVVDGYSLSCCTILAK